MSFQDDAGDFTMVSHQLAAEVGLICAAVYGAVWRYCNMKGGNCRASLSTIGADLNIDRATAMRCITKLVKLGYLIDQTPGLRNVPHTYILGKTVAQCNSLGDKTVAESHTNCCRESHQLLQRVTPTVAESHLNRDINRDSNRIKERGLRAEINNEVLEICGYDLKYLSTETGKKVNDTVTQLITWGATTELIREFRFNYWWGSSPPTLRQLVDEWSKFMTWKQNPGDKKKKDSTNGYSRKHNGSILGTGQELDEQPTIDIYTGELVYPDGHREPASMS